MNVSAGKIIVEQVEQTVLRLTIANPPANAVNTQMLADIVAILQKSAKQPPSPAVVLTGAGDRFFCAGGDINEVDASGSDEVALTRMRFFHALLCELERYPAPVITAVRGYAVGGGFEFILFADHVVTGENAKFGFPEINHGLLPAAKGMRQAARLLGLRAAQSLLYSGQLIDAARAHALGLANSVVSVGNVDGEAVKAAQEMRSKDLQLFATIKRTLRLPTLSDADLEHMSVEDMRAYLSRGETLEARTRFLSRKSR
jgi:enoyl-CoA hydratase/carnithine racemase